MPPRHLVDPKKSNKALGFPALIMGLCQFYGVSVTPTKIIQPPISRAFIEKYCMPNSNSRRASSSPPQMHCCLLIRLIWLGHLTWSGIYGIWFASRQQTTGHMCRPMIVCTR